MKIFHSVFAFILALIVVMSAQRLLADELHMKDGSIIRGQLISETPGQSYRIKMSDGSEVVYPAEKVESVKFDKKTTETESNKNPTKASGDVAPAVGKSVDTRTNIVEQQTTSTSVDKTKDLYAKIVEEKKPNVVDITASFIYYAPGHENAYGDTFYKNGYGGEIQARFWPIKYIGLAIAAGGASWDVESREHYRETSIYWYGRRFKESYFRESVSGSVNMFPVGLSLLVRPIDFDRVSLTLEGGVRYVFVDSDVTYDAHYWDIYGGSEYIYGKADIEDGIIGLVGANLEVVVINPLFIFVGGGYQFDISKGTIGKNLLNKSIDHELKAFYAKAGLGLAF